MFKRFEINSIRSRMVTGFLFLTLLILILAVLSLSIINRITDTARMHSTISQLEIYTLSLMKSDNDFFDLETIHEAYFATHNSSFLERRDSINKLIAARIAWLTRREQDHPDEIRRQLVAIDSALAIYNRKFSELESLVFRKGFKDYGVEGAMRSHAHELEETLNKRYLSNLLYLRRHEKDFLLRNDTSYLTAFQRRATQLEHELQTNPQEHAAALFHLSQYRNLFIELIDIQLELGLSSKDGLRTELNDLTYYLSNQYYALSEYSYRQADDAYYNMRIVYTSFLAGAILFSLVSGYWISKRLSAPIAQLSRVMRKALRTGNVMKADFRIRHAANEISTLAGSFIQLMNLVNTQVDAVKTKSKLLKQKNKELKKLNRELDSFLYSTAHDLRAPLSSLLGLVHVIRHENKQPELLLYFEMMEKSIQRSEEFISQIVSFSKNKNTALHPEPLDLPRIIDNIFQDHHFIPGSDKVSHTVTIHGHAPFYSDKSRITILFNNLISNALKYADWDKPEQQVNITIELHTDEVLIEFMDNGIGIDEEHLDKIFDMFYRAHTYSKGSGLGLFIFREALTRLGGHAEVESVAGAGTRFYLRIPNGHTATRQAATVDVNVSAG